MPYPVTPMIRPTDLANALNGRLPDEMLTEVTFPGRGVGRLHRNAARAWKALAAKMAEAGYTITTSNARSDAYRTYLIQERTFLARYRQVSHAVYYVLGRDSRRAWLRNGAWTYWQKIAGVASAAAPGTSNHGWGLAVDVNVYTPTGIINLGSSPALQLMLGYAAQYGWSWEIQSEPWHLRYVAGDAIPQAVLDYERPRAVIVPPASRPGDNSPAVKLLQAHLIFHRLMVPPADGLYGAVTIAAVKRLQQMVGGATVDGWYGPASVAAYRAWVEIAYAA
jgi:LAS superfamily LD-carboxypeptidase LdcB